MTYLNIIVREKDLAFTVLKRGGKLAYESTQPYHGKSKEYAIGVVVDWVCDTYSLDMTQIGLTITDES